MEPFTPRPTFRFGDFELDLGAYELRRQGQAVRINRQAMDALILLVERRRQLVSRQDLVDRLWGKDVFVDVETGVNTAISKVRHALRDSAEAPVYVETVPGKGYRFMATVEVVGTVVEPPVVAAVEAVQAPTLMPSPAGAPMPPEDATPSRGRRGLAASAVVLVVVAVGVAVAMNFRASPTPARYPPSRVSLAVLPFENIGDDPARAYLAAGLAEETRALLAQADPERLVIKGRALHYKGTTKTAAEIGAELSVDYLLEGAMRTEGDRVRATATLIRVQDQAHVWSRAYDRETSSLLSLQQELSAAIADQVSLTLSPARVHGLARRQTQNAAAYDAYLRARYLASRRTAATNTEAIQEYQRAIALDPNYALAWAELAVVQAAATLNSDASPLVVGPLAREAAAHAIRANPDLAESQLARGYTQWLLDWDWPAADREIRRSLQLDPSNGFAHMVLGHVLSQMGRQREAEDAMLRARELEPLEALPVALSSQVAFQGRNYPVAIDLARRAVALDSVLWIGSMQLAQAAAAQGDIAVALSALEDAARFSAGNSKTTSLKGYMLAKDGRTAEARVVLAQLEAEAAKRYVPPYAMALVHAGLGDRDAVFEWLRRAYDARDVHLIYLPVDAKWDPYRADPRFAALLTLTGFAITARVP